MEDNNVMNNTAVNNTDNSTPAPPPAEQPKTPEQTEAEKKKAFEEEEAKRKAEFDAKKAKRDEEVQIEWELNLMVTPDELFANAQSILSKDIERITQKTMKECVGAHIINASQQNEIIAKHVVHPQKNSVNCFRYINRKAREYLDEHMKFTGEKPDKNGVIGIDIPDGLCYQWAEEYFSSTNIPEDHEDEEKFEPRKYTSSNKPTVKKNDKKKKASAPKAETPPQENAQEQMALF